MNIPMRIWLIILVLMAAAIPGGCGNESKFFKYRMTVDVESDGVVHSASSVIEVEYIIGRVATEGKKWASRYTGVAPIVDLGKHGWVVAAMTSDSADIGRKLRALGRTKEPGPINASQIPLAAFDLPPIDIDKAKGKAVLTEYLPNFIWVPQSGGWQAARQLLADEFPKEIAPGVKLVQVTVEPAPEAAIASKVEKAPAWLLELRESQPESGVLAPSDRFTFRRYDYVEHYRLKTGY